MSKVLSIARTVIGYLWSNHNNIFEMDILMLHSWEEVSVQKHLQRVRRKAS